MEDVFALVLVYVEFVRGHRSIVERDNKNYASLTLYQEYTICLSRILNKSVDHNGSAGFIYTSTWPCDLWNGEFPQLTGKRLRII